MRNKKLVKKTKKLSSKNTIFTNLSVRLPSSVCAKFRRRVTKNGMTVSGVLREMIINYVQ